MPLVLAHLRMIKWKSVTAKDAADELVCGIKRKTRQHSANEKIIVVLARLRCEERIAALCHRAGIAESFSTTGGRNSLRQ